MARLIDRPRSAPVAAGSARRSYTRAPRCRAGRAAAASSRRRPGRRRRSRRGWSAQPSGRRTTSSQRVGGPPAVVEGDVQRSRREPDDVGFAGVGEHAVLVPQPGVISLGRPARAPGPRAGAPRGRVARRDDSIGRPRQPVEQRLEVAGQAACSCARSAVHADLVEHLQRRAAPGAIARIGGLDSCQESAVSDRRRRSGAIWNRVAGRSLHQPASFGSVAVGQVPLVHEGAGHRARPAVEVLVRAPGGPVDVPVVQPQRDVARCVGQVPADDRAGGVAGAR